MPTVYLTREDKKKDEIKSVLHKYMGAKGIMSIPKLSKRCGVPEQTLYKRLREPNTWTIGELVAVFSALDIPEEESMPFIRYRQG